MLHFINITKTRATEEHSQDNNRSTSCIDKTLLCNTQLPNVGDVHCIIPTSCPMFCLIPTVPYLLRIITQLNLTQGINPVSKRVAEIGFKTLHLSRPAETSPHTITMVQPTSQ
jgi:hypothetical protein